MKKLMIALSAAALAFGLKAELPEGVVAKEGFAPLTDESEGFTMTAGEGTVTTSTTAYISSYVTGGQIAPNAFGENTAGDNLQLKTPFSSPATLAFTATSMEGLYFDSMVKFTACDEAPSTTDYSDAKIIVWVKENEDANGNITKNLMVTAGNIADPAKPAPKDFDCGLVSNYGITGDDDWCRLTIKAIPNIGKGASGFIVFVNGKTVEITGEYKDIGLAETDANWKMVVWLQQNKLFPSLAADDTDLSAVEFAGQGGVDDLVVSTIEPRDANGGLFYNEATPAIAEVDGVSTGLTSVDLIQAKLNDAAANTTVKLLYDVTGDLSGNLNFPNAYTLTFDLNGKTFNGNLTCGEFSKVTITDSSANKDGKIEGTVESDSDDPLFVLDAGKVKISTNDGFTDNVTPKTGMMFDQKDGYYVLVTLEDGSADYPYLINSAADLAAKTETGGKIILGAAGAGKCYKMTADIPLTGEWKGIGAFDAKDNLGDAGTYTNAAFQGIFDGDGKTISGLVLQRGDYVGFFGSTYGATVKNLKISLGSADGFGTAANATSTDTADNYGGAAFVGVSVNTTIENCETVATDTYKDLIGTKAIGGIVGYAAKGTVVKGCVNNLNLKTDNEKCGGLMGIAQNTGNWDFADVVIDGCTNNGNVTCNNAKKFIAGLVSYMDIKVIFKGANTFAGELGVAEGGEVYSVSAPNGGANELDNATFTVPAGYKTTKSGKAVDGLFFATVDGTTATLVKNADVKAGGSFKVMADGAPALEITLNKDESISIDTALATVDVSGIVAAEGCKLTTATEGTVTTYTAEDATVHVTGVTLNKTQITLPYQSTETLTATVAPEDAADKSVSWSSDNTAVATVENGTVTAVGVGNATITVTTTDGSKTATCAVTVEGKPVSVTVTLDSYEATWSEELALPTPTVEFGIEGITAADYDAAWDNTTIPTENPSENVTRTYTVTLKGNYTGSGDATFTIKPKSAGPTIPEEQGEIEVDQDGNVNVTPAADVTEIELTGVSEDATVTIPSSVEKIKGVAAEQVKITYTAAEAGAKTYDITGAFEKKGDATEGVTYELDPNGEVDVDGDGVMVPVTPTITEAASTEGTIADGAVATKAIPGLTYTLMRATSLAAGAEKETADSAKAISSSVSLKDGIEGDKPAQAFYTIKVTK